MTDSGKMTDVRCSDSGE